MAETAGAVSREHLTAGLIALALALLVAAAVHVLGTVGCSFRWRCSRAVLLVKRPLLSADARGRP